MLESIICPDCFEGQAVERANNSGSHIILYRRFDIKDCFLRDKAEREDSSDA